MLCLSTGCSSFDRARQTMTLPTFRKEKASDPLPPPEKQVKTKPEPRPKREPLVAELDSSVHDSETRELIASELRDVSAGEREEWISYLNNVDRNMVPFVLKARRLEKSTNGQPAPSSRNADPSSAEPNEQKRHPIEENNSTAPRPGVLTAGHSDDAEQPSSTESDVFRDGSVEGVAGENAPLNNDQPSDNTGPELKAPSTTRNLSDRLKSLADWEANPIWPGSKPESTDKEEPPKRERSILPRILGNRNPLRLYDHADDEQTEDESSDETENLSRTKPPAIPTATAPLPPNRRIADPILFDLEEDAAELSDAINQPARQPQQPTQAATDLRIAPDAALWEDELHRLISLLEAETSAATTTSAVRRDVRQQVALRMLYLISDEPQMAQQAIPGLNSAEQEFWTALFWGLSEQLSEQSSDDPDARREESLAQLRIAVHHLQRASRLRIRNASFCNRIHSFGNYDEFPSTSFTAGQRILVYAEMKNFKSEPTVDGFYRSAMKSTIEIIRTNPAHVIIDRNDFPTTEDFCRTMRTDYFHSYPVDLPSTLSPGSYILKLIVTDDISGKTSHETLDFTIQ